jgi:TolB-like protein
MGIRVAILPFQNLSSDNTLHHICEGFTLDLITDLSRFKSFKIISWRTTELLQPDAASDSEVIKKLDTDYIIKGTFRHYNNTVRINAQLINTKENRLVWAEKYEGSLENIFTIQENIIQQLVAALQQHLDYDLLLDFKKRPSANLSAYTYWLLGFRELKKGTIEADEIAREYFQRAIEMDPGYSRAYTGMSLTYFNEWSCQIWDRWEVSQKGAFEYAKKAFELDENDYISSLVLGRVYLYNGEYETSEHYIRKSIRLNSNDVDILIQAATCLTHLNYAADALKLYERAMHLNPMGNERYWTYGAFIYFELGDYKKALELTAGIDKFGWVDMPGFIAAAYYMLGDMENMQRYWDIFLDHYRERINAKPFTSMEALEWMIRINPFRGRSNVSPFWDFMRGGGDVIMDENIRVHRIAPGALFVFKEEGALWRLVYEGKELLMPAVKGFGDIQKLLCEPGKEIHCSVLMGASVVGKDDYELFDEKAKNSYKQKILSLQEEIGLAEETSNYKKAEVLQQEYDNLIEHLSQSVGLGGKVRKAFNPADKIRSAVTWRIRTAIKKIENVHPALAKHLSLSVKTGIFCSYSPEKPFDWVL